MEYFSVAPGRVGAPSAGGFRDPMGPAIFVTPNIGRPTEVTVAANRILSAAEVRFVADCAAYPD